ncbi:MAG: hypothetical protein ACYCVB_08470 [Bacilli bacterium]
MTHKLTFQFDPQTGRIKSRVGPQSGPELREHSVLADPRSGAESRENSMLADPRSGAESREHSALAGLQSGPEPRQNDARADRGLEDILRHAREAASAYDSVRELRFGGSPARPPRRSARTRFAPRGDRLPRGARKRIPAASKLARVSSGNGRAFHARRGDRPALAPLRSIISLLQLDPVLNLPRLREVAFAALSIGVTLGALLIATVHGAAGPLAAPAQSRLSQTGSGAALAGSTTGANVAVTVNVAATLAAAAQRSALVAPAVSTLMYEGGEFATRARATAQANGLRTSGVRAFVSAGPPYTLLFAPLASGAANTALGNYLRRAEAPFYVRAWNLPGRTFSMTGHAPGTVQRMERLVAEDARILQGLLAVHAGYQAPQLGAWERTSRSVFGTVGQNEWRRLGRFGARLEALHEAVQRAFGAVLFPGAGAGGNGSAAVTGASPGRQSVLLTEALLAYDTLVHDGMGNRKASPARTRRI